MKFLLVFASLFCAIYADSVEQEWANFKKAYSRVYDNSDEEKQRFQIFKSNFDTISEHNSRYNKGEVSYTLGVNQFADLTDQEFEDKYLVSEMPTLKSSNSFEQLESFIAPASVDWRTEGAVFSVKDQGNCKSWYAFSAVAAVEAQNHIKHNRSIELSEQEIVDCSWEYRNRGCKGGLTSNAILYMEDYGVASLDVYPYTGSNKSACRCMDVHRARVDVIGFQYLSDGESLLEKAVATLGPLAVTFEAKRLKLYKSGVFDDPLCGQELDHGALVVGYGEINNKQYWIVKNSWGTTWGDNGYILMSRNKNNQCGIAAMAFYPNIL